MTTINNLLPEDVSLKMSFMDSEFQNTETETIVKNIVFIQQKMNPKQWTPFSFDDYREHCTHNVSDAEKGVLEAFGKGGKPVWNTSAFLEPGYLNKETDLYSVTDKFLNFLLKVTEKQTYRLGNQDREYKLLTKYLGWFPDGVKEWWDFFGTKNRDGQYVTIFSPDKIGEVKIILRRQIIKDAFPLSFFGEKRSQNWYSFCVVSTQDNPDEEFIIPLH